MGSVDGFKVFWNLLPPVLSGRSEKFTLYERLSHPKTVVSLTFYVLLNKLLRRVLSSCFMDEKTGVQRSEVTCPGSQF